MFEYKEQYEQVIEHSKERVVMEQYLELFEEFCDVLCINNFSQKGLHTLVFMDDTTNSKLLTEKSYVFSLLSENRQPRVSFFLCIQFWKGVNASLKPNINTLYLFGTFSKQQVSYILSQIHLNMNVNQFFDTIYRKLSLRNHVIIDSDSGEFKIV